MASPDILVSAYDLNDNPLCGTPQTSACLTSYRVNSTNGAYSDATVRFSSAESGHVFLQGGQTFTYYVDQHGGSDSYSGASRKTPFRNLTAVPPLTAGQSVGLACGSAWRQEADWTADNISVQSYGNNCMPNQLPLIDSSDIIPNSAFSATGGYSDTFQATVTPQDPWGTTEFPRVWQNGGFGLTWESSISDVSRTPGSYTFTTSAPYIIYVNPGSGSNPAKNGKLYEYSSREFGLGLSGNHVTLRGIWTRRQNGIDGSIDVSGSYPVIEDTMVTDGSKHNILCGTGCYADDVWAINADYGGQNLAMFVFFANVADNEGITIYRCAAVESGGSGVTEGFLGHVGTSGNFGTVVYDHVVTSGVLIGLGGSSITNAYLNGNILMADPSAGTASTVAPSATLTVSGGLYSGGSSNGVIAAAPTTTIEDAGFISGRPDAPVIYGKNIMALTITGSTITAGSNGVAVYLDGARVGKFVGNKNNFPMSKSYPYFFVNGLPSGVASDYNAFTSSSMFRVGNTTYSVSRWKSTFDQDEQSTP